MTDFLISCPASAIQNIGRWFPETTPFLLDIIYESEISRTPILGDGKEVKQVLRKIVDPRGLNIKGYIQGTIDARIIHIAIAHGLLFCPGGVGVEQNILYKSDGYPHLPVSEGALFLDGDRLSAVSYYYLPESDKFDEKTKKRCLFPDNFAIVYTQDVQLPYDQQTCHLYLRSNNQFAKGQCERLLQDPTARSHTATSPQDMFLKQIKNPQVREIFSKLFADNDITLDSLQPIADAKSAGNQQHPLDKLILVPKTDGILHYCDILFRKQEMSTEEIKRRIELFNDFKSQELRDNTIKDDQAWLLFRLYNDHQVAINELSQYKDRIDLLMLLAYMPDADLRQVNEAQQQSLGQLYKVFFDKTLRPEMLAAITHLIQNQIMGTDQEIQLKIDLRISMLNKLDQLAPRLIDRALNLSDDKLEKLSAIISHLEQHHHDISERLNGFPDKKQQVEQAFRRSSEKVLTASLRILSTDKPIRADIVRKQVHDSLKDLKLQAGKERHPWLHGATKILANAIIFSLTFGLAQEIHAQATGKYWFFNHQPKSLHLVEKAAEDLVRHITPSA